MAASAPEVTPWWSRGVPAASCSAAPSSEVSCKFYSMASTVCKMQHGEDGMPARKCQRLVRRLRDCGRGLEELHVEREEVIESNFRGDVNDVDDLDRIFGTPTTSGQPLDANVGEAIEEFMHFAEGLKHQTLQGECKMDEMPQQRLPCHSGNPDGSRAKRRGFLSRMLAREAECSPGMASVQSSKLRPAGSEVVTGRRRQQQHTWQEYARDFREV